MSEWSTYMQNPEFLASTRIFTLSSDYRELTQKWIKIKDGMKVLDVGCGTGEYTKYISHGMTGCEFYGVDIDDVFIEYANTHKCEDDNSYNFIKGNALQLPFQDQTFDLVVSHTFLTNINKPLQALREMMRVAKKGATICSVTAQALSNIPHSLGQYPLSHGYYVRYLELESKVFEAYEQIKPMSSYLNGINPADIPHYFVKVGLWNISMHSTPNLISLSSADIPKEDKIRYIENDYLAKRKKLEAFCDLEEFNRLIPKNIACEYLQLLEERKATRLSDIYENSIFEWSGGCTNVMTGVVPLF